MPDQSKNPFQFWHELKRRKVIRVIAMYAATAFILLEVVDIVAPSLGLPSWTLNLVIVLLCVGFPIAVIFSWVFDITPEGLKKTESVKVAKGKTPPEPVKRKLRVGDLIIAVLLVIVVILAYPREIKSKASLRAMTMPMTFVNELGEKETRRVFKDSYVTKLAIYPFTNERNDSSENWLQYGIRVAIYEDLKQFGYILLGFNNDANHLQEQIKFAKTNNYSHFLTGSFRTTGGEYEITSKLHETKNGSVIAEKDYKDSDFFSLIDSISLDTRIDLGIPENILNSSPDLPINEQMTNNFDAFRYYIEGSFARELNNLSFYSHYPKAIELDSTFALALYNRAFMNHFYQESNEGARKDINQAMRHKDRLCEFRQISIQILYYLILGEEEKAIALSEHQYEYQPNNIRLLLRLIDTYRRNFRVHEFEKAAQQLNVLVPDQPGYQIMLARSYLFTGKLNKGLKVLEKLLKDNPENKSALLRMGELYLHKNDLEAAEEVYREAILYSPENEKYWSKIFDHIAYIQNNTMRKDILKPLTGEYRFEGSELNITVSLHNNHLLFKAPNQYSGYQYPVSDSQFVSYNGNFKDTFIKNKQDNVIKIIHNQRNYPPGEFDTVWKEDSLIFKAKDLMNNGNKTEALSAFREAYDQNPEHYYLANYIQHLVYVQSEEYDAKKPFMESYSGKYFYEDLLITVLIQNNKFIIEFSESVIDELLPLSEDQFMDPSGYSYLFKIVKEDNQIKGINAIYSDGKETFYLRTSEQALANQNE